MGGYIAAFLMGSAFCAIGLFTSSFAREQVVALLSAYFVCIPITFLGTSQVDLFTPEWLSPIGKFVSFSVRFDSIEKGVLEFADMFFFLSFTAIFVFLNITVVEYRRLR